MLKTALDNVSKLKVVAFLITLSLVLFYQFLPKKTLLLHPQPNNFALETTDQVVGGNSEFSWINKDNHHWLCHFKSAANYPYCNISVAWSPAPYKTIDFTPYIYLEMDLEYKGNAEFLRVFVRNYYDYPSEPDMLQSGKFNTVTRYAKDFQKEQPTRIYLNELRVSDWWIDDYQVPPQSVMPEVNKTVAFGIDIPHPAPLGKHTYHLKSLTAVGVYFSKETLYFAIIIFWTVFLLGEMLVKYLNLQKKSNDYGKLLSKMTEQKAAYKEKAETDKLTRILNREGLSQIITQLKNQKLLQQYALIVLDLDHFKKINDTHGHVVGDSVLQDVASILNSCMRSYDIVARWGGEEFVILFHCLDDKNMLKFSEKVRKTIETATYSNGKKGFVTASLGVAKIEKPEDYKDAFQKADEAVYEAKKLGRNRTIIAKSL